MVECWVRRVTSGWMRVCDLGLLEESSMMKARRVSEMAIVIRRLDEEVDVGFSSGSFMVDSYM